MPRLGWDVGMDFFTRVSEDEGTCVTLHDARLFTDVFHVFASFRVRCGRACSCFTYIEPCFRSMRSAILFATRRV